MSADDRPYGEVTRASELYRGAATILPDWGHSEMRESWRVVPQRVRSNDPHFYSKRLMGAEIEPSEPVQLTPLVSEARSDTWLSTAILIALTTFWTLALAWLLVNAAGVAATVAVAAVAIAVGILLGLAGRER